MNIFYRLAVYFLRGYFSLFYRYRVYGIESIPSGAAIIAPNHHSFLDPPLLAALWPEREIHFLARTSLFSYFPLGVLLRNLNTHPVEGTAQDIASIKLVYKLLSNKQKVVIFPEGIRSTDGNLQPIKMGVAMLALKARCPIIPVYIKGTFESWPRGQAWPSIGRTLEIAIGQPLDIEAYQRLEKKQAQKALTERLRIALENLKKGLEEKSKKTT